MLIIIYDPVGTQLLPAAVILKPDCPAPCGGSRLSELGKCHGRRSRQPIEEVYVNLGPQGIDLSQGGGQLKVDDVIVSRRRSAQLSENDYRTLSLAVARRVVELCGHAIHKLASPPCIGFSVD